MKNIFLVLLLAVVFSLSPSLALAEKLQVQPAGRVGAITSLQTATGALPTDQIIIKYKALSAIRRPVDVQSQTDSLSALAGVTLSYFRPMSGDAHVLKLPSRLPLKDVESVVAHLLAGASNIEYAQPDYIYQVTGTPDDPLFADQWNYQGGYGIHLPGAWDITTGSSNIRVAVIDTGILKNHPELSDRYIGGYDFISNLTIANDGDGRDSDATDPGDWIELADVLTCGQPGRASTWHGSHVSGIIAAKSNNGIYGAGINWVSKVVPIRAIGKCGAQASDVVDAIRWAAGLTVVNVPVNPYPAQVINMSLGGTGTCDSATQSAITDAKNAGVVVVVAAGNDNTNASGFAPASCTGVIAVAASNRDGDLARFDEQRTVGSNYGSIIKISAPGGETWHSKFNGISSPVDVGKQRARASSYNYYMGTSMAAPHISGIVSLMLSVNPSLTPDEVLQILQQTATQFPADSSCTTSTCGAGIANAEAAVREAYVRAHPGEPLPTLGPTPTPIPTPSIATCPSVIVDGGFENTAFQDWTASSGVAYASNSAHSGAKSIRLGQAVGTIVTLTTQANITIPTSAVSSTFTLWYQVETDSFNNFLGLPYDYLHFIMVDPTTKEIVVDLGYLTNLNRTSVWTPITRTLSIGEMQSLSGKAIKLQLEMENNLYYLSTAALDDLAWNLCGSSQPVEVTPSATSTRTATPTQTQMPTTTRTSTPTSTATMTVITTSTSTRTPTPTSTRQPSPTQTPLPSSAISGTVTTAYQADALQIRWVSSVPTKAEVAYGTLPGVYDFVISEGSVRLNHSIVIPHTKPGTSYYFTISQTDEVGNRYSSIEQVAPARPNKFVYVPLVLK